MQKPLFITFEGGEGSGKSTQANLLYERLKKHGDPLLTREPGGSKLAEDIRKIVINGSSIDDPLTEFALISAARRDHVNKVILPALENDQIVICDRFLDSSLVYQGIVKGLSKETIMQIHNLVVPDIKPDITFLLDIEPKVALTRLGGGREKNHYDSMGLGFHEKIRLAFLEIQEENSDRIILIDGSESASIVHEEIYSYVTTYI